jgi:hypothetical protein
MFWMRVYEIRKEVKQPKVETIQNLINIESDDIESFYLYARFEGSRVYQES